MASGRSSGHPGRFSPCPAPPPPALPSPWVAAAEGVGGERLGRGLLSRKRPQGGYAVPGLLRGSVSGTSCPRGLIWKPQLIFPLNREDLVFAPCQAHGLDSAWNASVLEFWPRQPLAGVREAGDARPLTSARCLLRCFPKVLGLRGGPQAWGSSLPCPVGPMACWLSLRLGLLTLLSTSHC